jgi:Fur family zinc uptake transcriptional regulator
MIDPATLTGHQRSVLDALHATEGPLSAYALLDAVAPSGIRAPVQVYRALDKLVAAGLVHKIESLNAFIACADHETGHWAAFTICDNCGAVDEVPLRHPRDLVQNLELSGFRPNAAQLELRGICARCAA